MNMLTYLLTFTVILQTPVISFAIISPLNPALPPLSGQLLPSLLNLAQVASPGGGWWLGQGPLWTPVCS